MFHLFHHPTSAIAETGETCRLLILPNRGYLFVENKPIHIFTP